MALSVEPEKSIGEREPPQPPTLGRLFGAWLLIGTQSFGGGGSTIALINNAFVNKLAWVTEAELARDSALCQLTPGINLLALAVRLGGRIGGRCGSTAAGVALSLAGLLLPSVTITIAITAAYTRVAENSPAIQSALRAVIPATVGLGLLTAGSMLRSLVRESAKEGRASAAVTLCLAAGAGGIFAAFHPPVPVLLVAAGAAGALCHVALAARAPAQPGAETETP